MNVKTKKYDYILAIDQGGHASRATVYNSSGKIITSASCNISTQHVEVDGSEYIQHDATEIVESIHSVILSCMNFLGATKTAKIKAGLATQRSTIVCWNYITGQVLSKAISWQDTRASKFITHFKDDSALIKSKTGLFLSAHYGASKIKWCLDNLSAVQHALECNELCIAPLSSYLIYSCTAGSKRVVDTANATRTLLYNYTSLDWDEELLSLFAIPKSVLPKCVTSKYDYGQLLNWDGLCDVQLCTGDQSAAVLAHGIPAENEFTVNIGSGAFVLNINKKTNVATPILSTCIYTDSDTRINGWEGTVNGAGTALDWFQKQNPTINIYEHLSNWLRHDEGIIPLFINGISGVGSPYWLTGIESRFIGEAKLAAKAIAVIESIAFLITENINLMKSMPFNVIKITGGLSILDGLCQKISNLTQMTVIRSHDKEATLLGIVFLLSNSNFVSRLDNNFKKNRDFNIKNTEQFLPVFDSLLNSRYVRWKKEMQNET